MQALLLRRPAPPRLLGAACQRVLACRWASNTPATPEHWSHYFKPKRLKELGTQYGKVAVVFHTVVWGGTLGGIWAAIHLGLDLQHLTSFIPFAAAKEPGQEVAKEFALAYTTTLATSPARFALDVVAVPVVGRHLGMAPAPDDAAPR